MAVAGCGSHSCRVIDRGGSTVATADVLTEIEWNRVLDGWSTARAVINPVGDCCNRLGAVTTWRHRLVVYRDETYVWDGPITSVNWSLGEVELLASDILIWLDNRVPHQDMSFTNVDLTAIASALIEDGFAPDDPGHTVEIVGSAGVVGSRSYMEDIGQVGDHLKALADAGLDYTALGSKILLLPETHAVSVGRLSDADFPTGLVVSEDGTALATRWVVAGSDSSGVVGDAGGVDGYYGLLERYVEQNEITDTASATAAAQARLRGSLPVPVFVDTQQVTISPDAAVDVSSLVPGWCLDITSASTCRTVSQRLKIVGLKVTESGGDADTPGEESVQVQVAATGAESS